MRKFALLILCSFLLLYLYGQEGEILIEGKVSYITLQNIYVKFEQPGMVQAGDTISIRRNGVLTPLLVAESVSSTSCVGKPLANFELKISDIVFVKPKMSYKPTINQINQNDSATNSKQQENVQTTKTELISTPVREQKIRGRLSASSYSSFSNSSDFNQRMR